MCGEEGGNEGEILVDKTQKHKPGGKAVFLKLWLHGTLPSEF